MALEKLPVETVAAAACEDEYLVKKITSERFPLGLNWGPTEEVNADVVNEFLSQANTDLLIIIARDHAPSASVSSFVLAEFIRIRHLILRAASCPVRMVMETAVADATMIWKISELLGCIPYRVSSDGVSAFQDEHLYWVDSEWILAAGECKNVGRHWVQISPQRDPERLDILGPDCQLHPDFPGAFPPPSAYKPSSRPPQRPKGYTGASDRAKRRWRQAGFPTGLEHWKDAVMLWPFSAFSDNDVPSSHLARIPSSEVTARGMGYSDNFSSDWAGSAGVESRDESILLTAFSRSSCVPIILRILANILVAAALIHPTGTAKPSPLAGLEWPRQKQPDILEHIREKVGEIADKYKHLVLPFFEYLSGANWRSEVVGPDPGMGPRHQQRASLGVQSGLHVSSKGAPALLPLVNSEREHMVLAQEVVHPYQAEPVLPLDLSFAWDAILSLEEKIKDKREEVHRALLELASDLEGLDAEARSSMPAHVKDVAGRIRPALLIALIYILHWPDWNLPDRFVGGFNTVWDILASNLYPTIEHQKGLTPDELLGNKADVWNDGLASATDVTPEDDVIFEATEKATWI